MTNGVFFHSLVRDLFYSAERLNRFIEDDPDFPSDAIRNEASDIADRVRSIFIDYSFEFMCCVRQSHKDKEPELSQ